jgi:predicted membrane channel-forming protein YqfA (hemolysin III family)
MNKQHQGAYHLIGWLLFLVSAVFFVLSSLQNADPRGLLGAVFFFVACLFFLVPLIAAMLARRRSGS